MIQATQLRPGMAVVHEGILCRVINVKHITPGNKRGMVQAKLRNMDSGNSFEHRFRSDDRVEKADLEQHEMHYLYVAGDDFHFMNTETFEQVGIHRDDLGNSVDYLVPDVKVMVEIHAGRPVGVEPPKTVDLKVIETPPGMKGATATNSPKPATLETGLLVQVPQFIEVGEVIRVDTSEGKYLDRAK